MGYNLLINGAYWGYNPLTNLLLTSWDIQVESYSGDGIGTLNPILGMGLDSYGVLYVNQFKQNIIKPLPQTHIL